MKFWLSEPQALLDANFLHDPLKPYEYHLNVATKLVFIIFIILFCAKNRFSIHFLLISIGIIIIIYYIKKRKMTEKSLRIENYTSGREITGTPLNLETLSKKRTRFLNGKPVIETTIPMPIATPFCNDAISIDRNTYDNRESNLASGINQSLVGPANPKTRIAPLSTPQIFDLNYWKANEFVNFPQINKPPPQSDMYLSGYAESTCCDYLPPGSQIVPEPVPKNYQEDDYRDEDQENHREDYREDYEEDRRENYESDNRKIVGKPCGYNPIVSPYPAQDTQYIPSIPSSPGLHMRAPRYVGYVERAEQEQQVGYAENYGSKRESYGPPVGRPCGYNPIVSPYPAQDTQYIPSVPTAPGLPMRSPLKVERENYEAPPESFTNNGDNGSDLPDSFVNKTPRENEPGWVNDASGYNPSQTRVYLPSNLPAGNCEQSERMAQYNKNLFTQTVTPGVYTRSQVNEPINSNIGISFQQQFEPLTSELSENNGYDLLTFTEHDPRLIKYKKAEEETEERALPENVYDPRFYGYGTSYRSFIDEETGQPRFFYDDINAIRMPNYVVRSKIDHLPYADHYGPIEEKSEFGNIHNPHMRTLVQDSWLRDSLKFRTELTERRMRKINATAWQKRAAPLGPYPKGSNLN